MTDPRDRVITDPGIGPVDPNSCSTLRSMVAADEVLVDSSAGGPVYYEPTLLQAATNHKTLEIETVKLSREIDPRKLPTELSLPRPAALAPNDSGEPQAEVAVTSAPLSVPPRRWRVPALLLTLLGAILLLVLARGRARPPGAEGSALNTVQPSEVLPQGALVVPDQSPAPASVIAPSPALTAGEPPELSAAPAPNAPNSLLAPDAPSAPVSAVESQRVAPVSPQSASVSAAAPHPASGLLRNSAKPTLPPSASREPGTALTIAKPKRAIY